MDTNIVIYLLYANPSVCNYVDGLNQSDFYISMISRLEVLLGFQKQNRTLEDLENYMDDFKNLDFSVEVCRAAALMDFKLHGKLKFKDLIIAATAKVHNLTLITSDMDFKKIKGLKVEYIRL